MSNKTRPYIPRKSTLKKRVLRGITAHREVMDKAQDWLNFLDLFLTDLAIRRNSLLTRVASPNATADEIADLKLQVSKLDIQHSDTWGLYQQYTLREPEHAADTTTAEAVT